MAIGWIGLLKSVPWGEVVSNAPKIAGGARTLWNTVSKKIGGDTANRTPAEAPPDAPLATRVAALEKRQLELQQQLASATGLIDSLAEQNTQLVARVDALRRRLRWLTAGLLALAGLSASMWFLAQ